MTADRYEIVSTPRRLAGVLHQRGSRAGQPTWLTFLFAALFAGAGVWMALVGEKVVPVNPASVRAPYWVLTAAGAVFVVGGMMLAAMALRQWKADRRRTEAAKRYSHEPALIDYAWDPNGIEAPRWSRAIKSVFGALFLTLFLSMFNWWAFFNNGPTMVKIIIGVFDLILLAVWWGAATHVGRAFKFGGSRVGFDQFPYPNSKPATIRWSPPTGLSRAIAGTYTLRCVEEWFEERRGSGGRRTRWLVHEQLWAGTWHIDQPRAFARAEVVELRFDIPPNLPSTNLSAERPVFWELEVNLEMPGFDFRDTYMIPIYGAPAAHQVPTAAE